MLAFIFPGQGSQRPGMGKPWCDHPSWEVVEELSAATERDLAHLLCQAGPDELTQTRNAQMACFSLSLVVLDAIERVGLEPTWCAGHSLGEYSALVAAGALGPEDGARLVAERGEAMQDAAEANPGVMCALIGIGDDEADIACRLTEDDVWVANYNAPGQVVIAGTPEAVTEAVRHAKVLGAKRSIQLQVHGAFHTPLMAPARRRLRKALAECRFLEAEVPVVANVDSRPHSAPEEWQKLLSAQLTSPVRWRQTISAIAAAAPETAFVEVGHGTVLTGLVKRIAPSSPALSVSTPEELDELVAFVARSSALAPKAPSHQGEHLYVSERVIVSPATGVFSPTGEVAAFAPDSTPGAPKRLYVGEILGRVGDEEVRSPFSGLLIGLLAFPGERVVEGQPLAWLRAEDTGAY